MISIFYADSKDDSGQSITAAAIERIDDGRGCATAGDTDYGDLAERAERAVGRVIAGGQATGVDQTGT